RRSPCRCRRPGRWSRRRRSGPLPAWAWRQHTVAPCRDGSRTAGAARAGCRAGQRSGCRPPSAEGCAHGPCRGGWLRLGRRLPAMRWRRPQQSRPLDRSRCRSPGTATGTLRRTLYLREWWWSWSCLHWMSQNVLVRMLPGPTLRDRKKTVRLSGAATPCTSVEELHNGGLQIVHGPGNLDFTPRLELAEHRALLAYGVHRHFNILSRHRVHEGRVARRAFAREPGCRDGGTNSCQESREVAQLDVVDGTLDRAAGRV